MFPCVVPSVSVGSAFFGCWSFAANIVANKGSIWDCTDMIGWIVLTIWLLGQQKVVEVRGVEPLSLILQRIDFLQLVPIIDIKASWVN